VDFARGEVLEVRQAKLLGERVDLCVLEQLLARHVDIGDRRVLLERPVAGDLPREVVACVEELEEAADGVDVLTGELNLAGLFRACRLALVPEGKWVRGRHTLPSSVNSAHWSAKKVLWVSRP
jgi:hypothetical protein